MQLLDIGHALANVFEKAPQRKGNGGPQKKAANHRQSRTNPENHPSKYDKAQAQYFVYQKATILVTKTLRIDFLTAESLDVSQILKFLIDCGAIKLRNL